MTTLVDAIQNIQYDSNWGIWAETPFTPESEARYGQGQFENGGLLDDKEFFATGEQCGNFIQSWWEGEKEIMAWQSYDAAEEMISKKVNGQ